MDKKIENFKKWLQEEELSANTIDSYAYTVWEFNSRYGTLSTENLLAWKDWLIKNHSVKTANLRIAGMNRYILFTNTQKRWLAPVKRFKTMKSLSVENAMTTEFYSRLIAGLTKDKDLKWVGYYKLLAKTGARISEALQMKVADLEKGFIILKTKGKVRRIWIPQTLKEDLHDLYKDSEPDSFLITNRYGAPMTSRGFLTVMQAHAKRYGIPAERMHPHALRHFFALQFLRNNQDITLLADLLGHSNLNTTMIYTRKSAEEQQSALNQAMNW